LEVIDMSVARLVVTGVRLEGRTVSEVARDYKVPRQWIHTLLARYDAEGEAGLEPRSRRPHGNARATPQAVEDRIVELRKQLVDDGLDAGAHTIAWHLAPELDRVPAPSTIWRILVRRGFVTRSRANARSRPMSGSPPTSPTNAGRPTPPTGSSPTAATSRSTSSTTTPGC
jgi:transposase